VWNVLTGGGVIRFRSTSDLSRAISLWVIVPFAVLSILCLNLVKYALCALLEASSFGNSSILLPAPKMWGAGNTTVIGTQLYFTLVQQRYKHGGHVE